MRARALFGAVALAVAGCGHGPYPNALKPSGDGVAPGAAVAQPVVNTELPTLELVGEFNVGRAEPGSYADSLWLGVLPDGSVRDSIWHGASGRVDVPARLDSAVTGNLSFRLSYPDPGDTLYLVCTDWGLQPHPVPSYVIFDWHSWWATPQGRYGAGAVMLRVR